MSMFSVKPTTPTKGMARWDLGKLKVSTDPGSTVLREALLACYLPEAADYLEVYAEVHHHGKRFLELGFFVHRRGGKFSGHMFLTTEGDKGAPLQSDADKYLAIMEPHTQKILVDTMRVALVDAKSGKLSWDPIVTANGNHHAILSSYFKIVLSDDGANFTTTRVEGPELETYQFWTSNQASAPADGTGSVPAKTVN